MNDLLALFYEPFFDYNSYQDLLNLVFDNADYGKLGFILILIPLVVLAVFYKLWDPIRNQLLMLGLSILLVLIIAYSATSGILYSNGGILQAIGNYTGDDGQIDPDYFVFQMSMISLLYGVIISLAYSFGLKLISTNNSHNPI